MKRSAIALTRRVGLLGFPEERNSSFLKGCSSAPQFIREQFHSPAFNYFCEHEIDVNQHLTDYGDVTTLATANQASLYAGVYPYIQRIIQDNHTPLVLGGDHSISYSVVKALCTELKIPRLTIVHFDAHPDIYDELDGSKDSHACQFARLCEEQLIQLISVGVRTVTLHQRLQMNRFQVMSIPAKDFPLKGSELGILLAPIVKYPLYVSFDMDVLEPGFAPGVSHREAGGLTPRQCIDAIQSLHGRLVGADLVEFNPSRDSTGLTASVTAKILKELASKIIRS